MGTCILRSSWPGQGDGRGRRNICVQTLEGRRRLQRGRGDGKAQEGAADLGHVLRIWMKCGLTKNGHEVVVV